MPISYERGEGGKHTYLAEEGQTATIDYRGIFVQGCGKENGGYFIVEGGRTSICLDVRKDEETGEPVTITDNFTVDDRTYQFTITAS